jgi:hypothetical protein
LFNVAVCIDNIHCKNNEDCPKRLPLSGQWTTTTSTVSTTPTTQWVEIEKLCGPRRARLLLGRRTLYEMQRKGAYFQKLPQWMENQG